MKNRRERFREYMVPLAAAAHPWYAIKENLYIPMPGRSVAQYVLSRLELEPTSSHLIVGGVGSGKTTQLLIARKLLRGISDFKAFYIDVAEKHDLARVQSGILLVLAGLRLGAFLKETSDEDVKKASKQFKRWANGWVEWVDEYDYAADPEDADISVPVHHKGVLSPPQPPLRWEIKEKTEQLKKLQQAAIQYAPHIVFLFDSLDRLTNLAPFAEIVEQDVLAMRSVGIGVVVVGPLHTMFATGRPMVDRFSYFYHQPSVDVQQDRSGQEFLFNILRRRTKEEMLPDESAHLIVALSGGVLRDLISLARAAGEEAYTAGADHIESVHVKSAADAFGRTLMLGLDADELKVLQRVLKKGTFVQASDKDIALLVTRRVLMYGDGRTRYAVHPTIAPLLEELSANP